MQPTGLIVADNDVDEERRKPWARDQARRELEGLRRAALGAADLAVLAAAFAVMALLDGARLAGGW